MWDHSPPGSSVHGNSSGKNTGVGCHAPVQGIVLTQGLMNQMPRLPLLNNPLSSVENY